VGEDDDRLEEVTHSHAHIEPKDLCSRKPQLSLSIAADAIRQFGSSTWRLRLGRSFPMSRRQPTAFTRTRSTRKWLGRSCLVVADTNPTTILLAYSHCTKSRASSSRPLLPLLCQLSSPSNLPAFCSLFSFFFFLLLDPRDLNFGAKRGSCVFTSVWGGHARDRGRKLDSVLLFLWWNVLSLG